MPTIYHLWMIQTGKSMTEPIIYRGLVVSRFWLDLVAGRIVLNDGDWQDKRRKWFASKEYTYHSFPWEDKYDDHFTD